MLRNIWAIIVVVIVILVAGIAIGSGGSTTTAFQEIALFTLVGAVFLGLIAITLAFQFAFGGPARSYRQESWMDADEDEEEEVVDEDADAVEEETVGVR